MTAVCPNVYNFIRNLHWKRRKKQFAKSGAVQGQQHELKGATVESSSSLDKVQTGHKKSHNPHVRRPSSETGKKARQLNNSGNLCTRCGKGPHFRDKFPAKDAIYHRCQRKGHFMSCCLTKSVSEVSNESYLDTALLDTVTDESSVSWQAQIELNGKLTPFKPNTGAEVTAISPDTYHSLHNVELSKPERILSENH